MNRFQTLKCPSCGASLGIPDAHQQYFRCEACDTALEDTAYEEPTPDIAVSIAASQLNLDQLMAYSRVAEAIDFAEAVQPKRTGAGCLVSLITVLALIGGAIAVAIWAFGDKVEEAINSVENSTSNGPGGYEIYSFASGRLIPSEVGVGDDLLVLARAADGQRVMYIDFEADPVTRWTASSADAAVGADDPIAVTDTMVFIAAERFIYALDRATGTLEYTVGLPDQIASYCVDCLQIFDGSDPMLIVLSSDGTLTGLLAETGASRWATRLPSDSSRQLLSVEGNPVVITGTNGTDGAVQTYDLATGAPIFIQVPTCGASAGRVHPVDSLLSTSDGGFVWVSDDGFGACAQRWAPGAETATWTAELEADPSTMHADALESVILDDWIVVPGRGGFWMVTDDGSARLVERPETDEIIPVGVTSTGIVIAEHSARGSGTWALVGVPFDPAQAVWQYALTGDHLPPDRLAIPNQRGWFVEPSEDSIVVVDVDDVGETVTFRTLDAATGIAGAPIPIEADGGSFELETVFGYVDGQVLIGADHRVVVADVTSGQIVATAP